MYPYINTQTRNALADNNLQSVRVVIYSEQGSILVTLTEANIIQKSFYINRYCTSGKRLSVGGVVSSEIGFRIYNDDHQFDSYDFAGSWLYAEMSVAGGNVQIPLGYYYIDSAPKKTKSINIVAYDSMLDFDVTIGSDAWPADGADVLDWLDWVLGASNHVTAYDIDADLPNTGYVINNVPDISRYTYRDILSFLCEIVGANAMFTYDRVLRIVGFKESAQPVFTLTRANRYSSNLYEQSITMTGVRVIDDETEYSSGSEGYEVIIENNPLITHNFQSVADNIGTMVNGYVYIPFSATTTPLPYLYPMDKVIFTDYSGNTKVSVITDITFKLNLNTDISARGKTIEETYYTSNDTTSREKTLLAQLSAEQRNLDDRTQRVIAFSEMMQNAMGLWLIEIADTNGGTKYYLSNAEDISEATYIVGVTDAGIGFTDDWNDGNPTWSYGVSASGEAYFSWVSAGGISVSKEDTPYSIAILPNAFILKRYNSIVTQLNVDVMNIPKLVADDYVQIGAIKMVSHTSGMDFYYVG